MRLSLVIAGVLCGLGLVAPAVARGDGVPVPVVVGGPGVGVRGHADRYVARRVAAGTRVERLWHGNVVRSRVIAGRFGVPSAAYDGSLTGLSGDRRTLVLGALMRAWPPRRTRLAVLGARRLRVREVIALHGFFTVDAISPNGRWLYLIHYSRPTDVLSYEVRAYDLRRGRLLAKPIVDPREPDEKMAGIPVTRTTSVGGRWAYTLYDRPDGAPFVHALDTQGRTAACIDLDRVPRAVRLVAPRGGGPLRVVDSDGVRALIDRRTFAVSVLAAPRPRKTSAGREEGGAPSWTAAPAAAAVFAGLAGIAVMRRRHARARSA